jgi:hypothetical protein
MKNIAQEETLCKEGNTLLVNKKQVCSRRKKFAPMNEKLLHRMKNCVQKINYRMINYTSAQE